jgi:LAGLIDADG-like domain
MWSRRFKFCIVCRTTERPHQSRGLCVSCYSRWLKEQFRLPRLLDASQERPPWSLRYERCEKCGTSDIPHRSRGLCVKCYEGWLRARHQPERGDSSRPDGVTTTVSREDLERAYVTERHSLSELARKYGCSRQFVSKLLKKYRIPARSLSQARREGMAAGRMVRDIIRKDGERGQQVLRSVTFDRQFFKNWSPSMAWVLGLLYTDGNLFRVPRSEPGDERGPWHVSLFQKEPEVLVKVRELLNCNANLYFQPKVGIRGELYTLRISDKELFADLVGLGLHARKSSTVRIPASIPAEYVSHFIRGCWDGDGSVHTSKGDARQNVVASFVTGSKDFAKDILRYLGDLGLPETTLRRGSGAFEFKYGGANCALLARVLYKDADASMWLNRKEELFRMVARSFTESDIEYAGDRSAWWARKRARWRGGLPEGRQPRRQSETGDPPVGRG